MLITVYIKRGDFIQSYLVHIFFITFIINIFITCYYLYSILEFFVFLNSQGSKLNMKKKQF